MSLKYRCKRLFQWFAGICVPQVVPFVMGTDEFFPMAACRSDPYVSSVGRRSVGRSPHPGSPGAAAPQLVVIEGLPREQEQ